MGEQGDFSKRNYCYACLSTNEERRLHCYNVQNEALRTIFQAKCICLCYLCKRIAQRTELFIQNVENNQIVLQAFHNLPDPSFDTIKAQTQPVTNLTHFPLDAIELIVNDDEIEEETFTVIHNRQEKYDVKVKIEPKEEANELVQQLKGEYNADDNDDLDPYVKEEDDDDDEFPLKLLKEELESEGINIKCLRKSLKKRKRNKKYQKEKDEAIETNNKINVYKIEKIYITREQCMEERAKAVIDKKYVNSVYKCENCLKGFNFKAAFEKHMEKHSESNGEYECDICKQRMCSEEKLQSHKKYHTMRYKCKECNLTRVSRLTIKDHYTAYHCNGSYLFSCPHCSKSFRRGASLRKHVDYIHKLKVRVQCAFCDKTYASKDVLKSHLIRSHPDEVSAGKRPKRCVCKECGMAFTAPSLLKSHSIKHSQRRDYYCVECNKSFKSDSILKHHLKTAMPHINYLELPLPCLHCDKRFAIRRDLDRHTNRVHLNVKPFQCDRCDKAYVNGWSLNEHKRLIHEGYKRPRRFPCTMCDKVFDRNTILKGHIRTHTGERPFQCSECPAQFSQAGILGTHVKLIHLKLTRDGRPKNVSNTVKM